MQPQKRRIIYANLVSGNGKWDELCVSPKFEQKCVHRLHHKTRFHCQFHIHGQCCIAIAPIKIVQHQPKRNSKRWNRNFINSVGWARFRSTTTRSCRKQTKNPSRVSINSHLMVCCSSRSIDVSSRRRASLRWSGTDGRRGRFSWEFRWTSMWRVPRRARLVRAIIHRPRILLPGKIRLRFKIKSFSFKTYVITGFGGGCGPLVTSFGPSTFAQHAVALLRVLWRREAYKQ